jgi:ketosteroid isomerase-like protein
MSQENVETVRAMFASYTADDVDAVIDAAAEDIELRPALVGGLEGAVYRGKAGFRSFLADVDAAWDEWQIEIEEFHDLSDTVLALGRVQARARDGMKLEARSGWVCGMRDRKVVRFRSFASSAEALEAVGCGSSDDLLDAAT